MLALFRSGIDVEEVAQRQNRSVRAVLIRLGGMLDRPPNHSDYIQIDAQELPENLVHQAREAFHQQRSEGSFKGNDRTGKTAGASLVESEKRILEAIGELRTEIRKLRAQVRHYYDSSKTEKNTKVKI